MIRQFCEEYGIGELASVLRYRGGTLKSQPSRGRKLLIKPDRYSDPRSFN